MKVIRGVKSACFWCAGCCIAGAAFILIYVLLSDFFDIEIDPAWVQAIGSIVAIVVAVIISNRSHQKTAQMAARFELENQFRLAWIAENLTLEAASKVLQFTQEWNEKVERPSVVALECLRNTLQGIMLQHLPHVLIVPVQRAISEINTAIALFEDQFSDQKLEQCYQMLSSLHAQIYSEYELLGKHGKFVYTQRVMPVAYEGSEFDIRN